MAISWALGLGMPDAGQAFTAGLEQGRQRRVEMETDNALRALIANPNDPTIINSLAPYNPQAALQLQGQQQKRMADQQRQQLMQAAYGGDASAQRELFGIDPDLVMKLDEGSRKKVKEAVDFVSNAALQIDSLPEEARPQAWAQYVQLAESRGMDIPAEYEQYSPQVLQAAIAEAGMIDKLLSSREPKYQVIPEGGTLVNTRDPSALAQVAQQNAGPQPGVVEDGYRFKGGNPADPNNWEKTGGPTQAASGNFPGH